MWTRAREAGGGGGAWLRMMGGGRLGPRAELPPSRGTTARQGRKGPALRAGAAWLASGGCLGGLPGWMLARVARGPSYGEAQGRPLMRVDEDDAEDQALTVGTSWEMPSSVATAADTKLRQMQLL